MPDEARNPCLTARGGRPRVVQHRRPGSRRERGLVPCRLAYAAGRAVDEARMRVVPPLVEES